MSWIMILLMAAAGAHAKGDQALEAGDLKRAETLLRQAVALDPQRSAAWLSLGFALGRQARRQESIEAMRHAVQADPQSERARRALALAYWLSGDRDASRRVLGVEAGQGYEYILVDNWGVPRN